MGIVLLSVMMLCPITGQVVITNPLPAQVALKWMALKYSYYYSVCEMREKNKIKHEKSN